MKALRRSWQKNAWFTPLLLPLSYLFSWVIRIRRALYRHNFFKVFHANVPVVVVGNISVGGAGKTPLVAAIVRELQLFGWTPAIVSRGYKGSIKKKPEFIDENSNPRYVGDEPVMLASITDCPLAVCANRSAALALIEEVYPEVDVIVSDDGLQHYAMGRDIEIAILNRGSRFGNRYLLPAGPLREPITRLNQVDMIVCHQDPGIGEFLAILKPLCFRRVNDASVTLPLDAFHLYPVTALAGIAHPETFFSMINSRVKRVEAYIFDDHYAYNGREDAFKSTLPIIMTAKDAVKCRLFAHDNMWYLEIEFELDPEFTSDLLNRLEKISNG